MKLLFDQNISFRLVNKIQDVFPGSQQVRKLGLEGKSDLYIWKFTKQHQFTIVTFDSDYSDLAMLYFPPPKVVWLRTGNMTTQNIELFLRKTTDKIIDFIQNPDMSTIGCLEIFE